MLVCQSDPVVSTSFEMLDLGLKELVVELWTSLL